MGASSVKPTWIRRIRLIAPALIDQRGADLIGGKPSILKESRLLCTFGQRTRGFGSEFSAAHLDRNCLPIDVGGSERIIDGARRDALLAQLGADSDGSLSSFGVVVNEARDESLVGNEPLGAELLHDAVDCVCVMAFCGQLAFELLGAVLPAREQANGRDLDRFVIGCHEGLGRSSDERADASEACRPHASNLTASVSC